MSLLVRGLVDDSFKCLTKPCCPLLFSNWPSDPIQRTIYSVNWKKETTKQYSIAILLPYIPGGPRLSKVNEKVRCNVERPSVLRALINDYNLYRRRAESKNQRSFLLRANVNVSICTDYQGRTDSCVYALQLQYILASSTQCPRQSRFDHESLQYTTHRFEFADLANFCFTGW